MKRTIAKMLLLCIYIVFPAIIQAQHSENILMKRISISINNKPLKEVLENISEKAGVGFAYSSNEINFAHNVSITAKNEYLQTVLNRIINGLNIEYKVVGQQIVFYKQVKKPQKHTVSGYITDAKSGERLGFATIADTMSNSGVNSNNYGFYSISLNNGMVSLNGSFVGYQQWKRQFNLEADTIINIRLEPSSTVIQEIKIDKNRIENNKVSLGLKQINAQDIKSIPGMLGESDVIKTLQTMPGIKGKDFANLSVRGGGVDQNLLLIDEAAVYKYAHLGNVFSVFNTDAIKTVKVYKGTMPASYGGRLSSVVDVTMREGNNQRYEVSGALGLLFSHLTVEGPIIKDKMSFLLSGRRSYFDIFFPLSKKGKDNSVYFMDLNGKINYTISEKDKLYFSWFNSKDVFGIKSDGNKNNLNYSSQTFSLRYNRTINSSLFSNLSLLYTHFYNESKGEESEEKSNYNKNGSISDYTIKNDYTWFLPSNKIITFGFCSIFNRVDVGNQSNTNENKKTEIKFPKLNSLENAVYISLKQNLTDRLTNESGLRFVETNNIGSFDYYNYTGSNSNISINVVKHYPKGKFFNYQFYAEPRIMFSYQLTQKSALKVGYYRNSQNIHLLSNTIISITSDTWYPSTPRIKQQHSNLYTSGYSIDFGEDSYTFSSECYYKTMINVADFKERVPIYGSYTEIAMALGNAHAYGIETELRKTKGSVTGWFAYTYSRAFYKIAEINNGKEYRSPYDSPHDLSLGLICKLSKRTNLSANWRYASGNATMLLAGYYKDKGVNIPYYSGKNTARLPDYHQLDLSLTVVSRKTLQRQAEGKRFYSAWTFSVLNVYNHINPLFLVYEPDIKDQSKSNLSKTLFFYVTPSVMYSFKF